jgi:hypothetical protein
LIGLEIKDVHTSSQPSAPNHNNAVTPTRLEKSSSEKWNKRTLSDIPVIIYSRARLGTEYVAQILASDPRPGPVHAMQRFHTERVSAGEKHPIRHLVAETVQNWDVDAEIWNYALENRRLLRPVLGDLPAERLRRLEDARLVHRRGWTS